MRAPCCNREWAWLLLMYPVGMLLMPRVQMRRVLHQALAPLACLAKGGMRPGVAPALKDNLRHTASQPNI